MAEKVYRPMEEVMDEMFEKAALEAAPRYEANIVALEAMISEYRGGKSNVHETMSKIADLITGQFRAAQPEDSPWDED